MSHFAVLLIERKEPLWRSYPFHHTVSKELVTRVSKQVPMWVSNFFNYLEIVDVSSLDIRFVRYVMTESLCSGGPRAHAASCQQ